MYCKKHKSFVFLYGENGKVICSHHITFPFSFLPFHPSLRLDYHWENSKICKKSAIFWFDADSLHFWIASRFLVKDECVPTLVRDIVVMDPQSCYDEEGWVEWYGESISFSKSFIGNQVLIKITVDLAVPKIFFGCLL